MTPAGSPFGDVPPATSVDSVDALLTDPSIAPGGHESSRAPTTDDAPDGAGHGARASKLRLGDILKEMGLASEEQISSALSRQKETRQRLGQLLDRRRHRDRARPCPGAGLQVRRQLPRPHRDGVGRRPPRGTSTRSWRGATASRPIRFLDDNTLLVAMVDPQNLLALQDLEIITGFAIQPAIASEEDIYGAIATIYRDRPDIDESAAEDAAFEEPPASSPTSVRPPTRRPSSSSSTRSSRSRSTTAPATSTSSRRPRSCMIRFRIDGVLHEIMSVPRRMQAGVISRLKIMAELDIAERRVPQDGRIGLMVGGKPIDMRVATLPTVYGEKIVMRLLDKSNVMLDLEDLGFSEKALKRFHKSFTKPYGAILVTGPDRLGQVDHAVRGAQHPQLPREERDHRGGPGRVPPHRHQPGAGERARRDDVRRGPALDPALRPRHRDGRRDPRPRDGADRRRVGAHRAPRAQHAAHQRRPRRALPSHRDGHRAVPHLVGGRLRAGAAARAAALPGVPRAVHGHQRDAPQERLPARGL